MFFSSARVPYEKGMLLEAVKLNDDFALEHFLLRFSATSRCSDGIIGGMVIRAHESTLTLEPGVFKLGESLGWLRDPLVLEMPLRKVWCRLWLMAENDAWALRWLPEVEVPRVACICLCRLNLTDMALLRNYWLGCERPDSPSQWERAMNGTNYVQLDYAMSASHARKPTLLPSIQQDLAALAKDNELKLWLLNGMMPLLDYFRTDDWTSALKSLCNMLWGNRQPPPEPTQPINLAG